MTEFYDLTKEHPIDKAIEYMHMAARQFQNSGMYVEMMEIDMLICKYSGVFEGYE